MCVYTHDMYVHECSGQMKSLLIKEFADNNWKVQETLKSVASIFILHIKRISHNTLLCVF